ncbi:MAG TPA: NAD(P)/FAD-dependent oxidoreductase [Dokdonella sp.]|uniref:NAD(P)/FAD-dependent oxidoreductase n=1 Tax=Dokdonella sp. TaxID=2291710 RepID=UPI0025B8B5BA|nr:NAD(P)/FAD-dependent oxidoreductase [Dokdonella sp.]MBX3693197.1 NAD(P)/FAD-dependent oxidoreductase [Dokdonella sp.]MCW5568435.1 NAD(P)/FAD-dependent oxidoreductase [Dokdonella sp.]HNR92956.1 NAD(P)/FAD-dependent oxidoreductase [Dokdonella sp.]
MPTLRLTELKLPLDHTEAALDVAVRERLGIGTHEPLTIHVHRRGVDARRKSAILFAYTLDLDTPRANELLTRFAKDPHVMPTPDMRYRPVVARGDPAAIAASARQPRPVVIGTGPCGLLAALVLAQMGLEPLVLERGKSVRERTRDTWGLWRQRVLDPESNVQFGEGGAGTFSDGKLYSQVRDPRHHGRKVLEEFVEAGAPAEILYVSKPHIGTFRLVKMVEHMRAKIEALGGEIRFGQRVDDILIEDGNMRGLVTADGTEIRADHVVLAIGHSARDTFAMLHRRGVHIEAKPFSIGARIEHPQSLVDRARYGPSAGHPLLGAADYKLVHHAGNGRAVYSFCMCPGGTVVAATSEPGRVVTNGMSQYSRDERNANSAIVVSITPERDYPGHVLAGIDFQRHWESLAFVAGGSDYSAPAQRVGDFLVGRASTALGEVVPSYTPGVKPADIATCLPAFAIEAMREAIPIFDRQIRGFALPDAVLTAVETRTSSPIRIRRDDDSLQSINVRGLYPAGEGAGYAGGILSAAIDGLRVAEALAVEFTGVDRRK